MSSMFLLLGSETRQRHFFIKFSQ